MKPFLSADGTIRCRGCGLHSDMCTCSPTHPMWKILAPLFGLAAAREHDAKHPDKPIQP